MDQEKNTSKNFGSFVDDLRSKGRYAFTRREVQTVFGLKGEAYQKVIQRYIHKGRIAQLRQNFYLIIPPEFAARQTLPLGYFVDDLMKFLERNYYVGLLTAAMYHGAAHQQPQQQFVVTEQPYLRPIQNRQSIVFCMKKGWNKKDVQQQKTDAGYINISTSALTAFDLVAYVDRVGGLNRVATVLAELVSALNEKELVETARRFNQTTILQRLGYLFDETLNETDLANAVYEAIESRSFYPTALSTSAEKKNQRAPNRWKIIPNVGVQTEI